MLVQPRTPTRARQCLSLAACLILCATIEFVLAELEARALRRERKFRDCLDPLALSDRELLKHYRFPRHELILLIEELTPLLQRRTRRGHAIPPHTQVLIALRVYASGSFQHVIGDTSGKFKLNFVMFGKGNLLTGP